MKKKGFIFILSLFLLPLFPKVTFAHVKWFTDVPPKRIPIEQVITPLFFVMTVFTALCLSLLIILKYRLNNIEKLKRLQQYAFSNTFTHYFLQFGVALSLLVQLLNGAIFAPDLHVHDVYLYVLTGIATILFFIPLRVTLKFGAIILLYVYIDFIIRFGLFHLLDYFFYIGIIFFFLLIGTKWDRYKFPILIMTLGFSLCWLSAEKWIYPDMTVDIIINYGVPTFGIDPVPFVKMAGFVEFAIGISWMICLCNRFFAIIFTIVTTLLSLLFGYEELIGHFLIIVMMLIFIAQNDTFKSLPSIVARTLRGKILFMSTHFIVVLFSFILIYYRFA